MEKIILDFLKEKTGVPVYMEVPEKRPSKFILVEKTGSSMKEYIYTMTVAIQSYDTTKAKASALNEEVKRQMLKLNELNEVSKVSINTDYPFADPQTKAYRYQAVFDIVHY